MAVILTQTARTAKCGAANDEFFKILKEITCDSDTTGPLDMEKVEFSIESDEACSGTIKFTHASGCAVGSEYLDDLGDLATESLGWLYDNEWCIGIIYVIAGPLIALFGVSMFPYIVASLVAIFFIGLVCGLGLAFGWMGSTGGSIAVLCVGLVLGIIAGCVVRRNIKWMLGLLGLIAGFFSGSLIFALISSMAGGWNAVWGFWVISCIMAIVGCVAAIYIGLPLVMIATSLVGSYLFMRSWTLFFPGNYPSES